MTNPSEPAALIKRLTYSTFGRYDHAEAENEEEKFLQSMADELCPLCQTSYRRFTHLLDPPPAERLQQAAALGEPYLQHWSLRLLLCPACGFWHLSRHDKVTTPKSGQTSTAMYYELHHAVCSEIPLNASELPIDEVRKHLARFWRQRKHITAQQAEQLVASVLRDHYGGEVLQVTANANAPDGGIDLILANDHGVVRRAVQVKRRISQDVEPVEDVRNFIGAMILSGNDNGIFVTTATRFSRDATAIASNANLTRKKLAVELIDGERVLELLENSNLRRGVQLPDFVDLDQEWVSDEGMRLTTKKLLFSDLSRLFAKKVVAAPRPRK